jgi:hypothetical protein
VVSAMLAIGATSNLSGAFTDLRIYEEKNAIQNLLNGVATNRRGESG